MFNNIKFSTKIALSFSSLLFLIVINVFLSYLLQKNISDGIHYSSNIRSIIENVDSMRSHEKDYIIQGTREHAVQVNEYLTKLVRTTQEVESSLSNNATKQQIDVVVKSLQDYGTDFNKYLEIKDQQAAIESRSKHINNELIKLSNESNTNILSQEEKNNLLTLILNAKWMEKNISSNKSIENSQRILELANSIIKYYTTKKNTASDFDTKLISYNITQYAKEYIEMNGKFEYFRDKQVDSERKLIETSLKIKEAYSKTYIIIENEIKSGSSIFTGIITVIFFVSFCTAIFMTIYLSNNITSQLHAFITTTRAISNGDYSKKVKIVLKDEIGELAESFNIMAENLETSEKKLLEYNKTLEEKVNQRTMDLITTLEDLKKTQSQLIQKEKMAALGNLIAGIAHEINTPLGAIGSSIGTIKKQFFTSIIDFFEYFQTFDLSIKDSFISILQRCFSGKELLSSKEERRIKRELISSLSTNNALQIHSIEDISDKLVDMKIYSIDNDTLVLLQHKDANKLIDYIYRFSTIIRSAETIEISISRASKIVFALKTYSRQDINESKVEASISEGIDITITLYQNILKHGIEVVKNYEPVPKILCYVDELNQVWTNLIHNAIHAMNNSGTLTIDVKLVKNNILVSINDTGTGIPDDIKSRIFDPFFTTKPPGEGSGLGLDIVRKIIEKHNGKLYFESQPGNTTFFVELPIIHVLN